MLEHVGACWSCGVAGREANLILKTLRDKKAHNGLAKKFRSISASTSSFASILFSIM